MKFKDLKVLGSLGRGGFGEVLLCKAKKNVSKIEKNELVAVKLISKENKDSVRAEIHAMKQLKNKPFVSQLLAVFQDRVDVFMVLKLYENGSLDSVIKRDGVFPLQIARNVIVDIILGLQYLHKIDIVHGDVKPHNVLIDNNCRAHIADFGLSFNYKTTAIKGMWGTPTYQSPEQVLNVYKLDPRVDYFNVGIILIEIFAGYHPFDRNENDNVEQNIVSLKYEMPNSISKEAISFIKNTLCDASVRLNVSTVLNHAFIEPLVTGAFNGFVWPSKIHHTGDCDNYYIKRVIVKDISGIEFTTSTENQTAEEYRHDTNKENFNGNLQEKPRLKSLSVVEMLCKKLTNVNGAEKARITKRLSGFYVVCSCGGEVKAV